MAVGLLFAGTAIAAGGSLLSGALSGSAAARQARAQKAATSRYAKALKQQASKMQGGMSQARIRSLQAAGAMQRASEAQQARTEAARGGRAPSAMLEAELGAAQQMAAVEQQKMLDQLSQQTAERKAATRQQLQGAALQSEAQAQAIDPEAMKKATMAPYMGQAISGLGASTLQAASKVAIPTMKDQYEAGKLTKLQDDVGKAATMLESGLYDLSNLKGDQLKAATRFNLAYSQATRPTYVSSFPEARDE